MKFNRILFFTSLVTKPYLQARTQDFSQGGGGANIPPPGLHNDVILYQISYVAHCNHPHSRTHIYYNGSLCIVLFYSLKSWVVSWRLSLVLRSLYSPLIISWCNLPWHSWGLREDMLNTFIIVKLENKWRQENFLLLFKLENSPLKMRSSSFLPNTLILFFANVNPPVYAPALYL